MTSLINTIAETERQNRTGDRLFWRSLPYFFELEVPASNLSGYAGTPPALLVPLVLNPTEISFEEPFAQQLHFTRGGGAWAEENGIVKRTIRIRGTTGFAVRPYRGYDPFALISPEKRSHARRTMYSRGPRKGPLAINGFSGQRHFQFLEDAIFRVYGDFKRDPKTAGDTKLYFHAPKDSEHWRVIPVKFGFDRSATNGRTTYPYVIELIAIDAAEAKQFPEEDRGILEKIRNTTVAVNRAVSLARGAVADVERLQAAIERQIQNVAVIMNNVTGVITDSRTFVEGLTDWIERPFADIEAAASRIEAAVVNADETPDEVVNRLRQMVDALDELRAHPEAFNPIAFTGRGQIVIPRDVTAPDSYAELASLGSGPRPGDALRAQAAATFPAVDSRFRSAFEYVVRAGDTLTNLAGRFLPNGAADWKQIAILNGLEYPYIAETGQPYTRRIGDRILIPSEADGPEADVSDVPVLGVDPRAPIEDRALGTDLRLAEIAPGAFDFALGATGTDFAAVSGVENLRQALNTRIRTERGTDPLFPRLGFKSFIGLKVPDLDGEIARFRLIEALEDDPRVAAVRSAQISNEAQPDALEAEVEIEIRGLNDPVPMEIRRL